MDTILICLITHAADVSSLTALAPLVFVKSNDSFASDRLTSPWDEIGNRITLLVGVKVPLDSAEKRARLFRAEMPRLMDALPTAKHRGIADDEKDILSLLVECSMDIFLLFY